MASSKQTGCALFGVFGTVGTLAIFLGSVVVCCGGGVVVVAMIPTWVMQAVTDEAPLAVTVPPPDPVLAEAARKRVCEDLLAVRPARITGAEITALAQEDDAPEGAVFLVQTAGDALTVDVSIPVEPGQWVNLHGKGGFTMDHGWFTDATFQEAVFSSWDLAPYLVGQQATQFNQSLANERAKSPTLGPMLEAYDSVATKGDAIELTPNAAVVSMLTPCAAYSAAPAVEALPPVEAVSPSATAAPSNDAASPR